MTIEAMLNQMRREDEIRKMTDRELMKTFLKATTFEQATERELAEKFSADIPLTDVEMKSLAEIFEREMEASND